MGAVGEQTGAIVAFYGEGFGKGGFGTELIVDAPGFKEPGGIGGELKAGLLVRKKRSWLAFSFKNWVLQTGSLHLQAIEAVEQKDERGR
jgi:hypothetical protein